MSLQKLKSLFLKSLIGCLIAAALLAVITVLIGQFNSVCARALFTIALIAVHCIVSFSFIVNNEKQETFDSLSFFANVTFILIVLSFITSILGTWSILPLVVVWKLYGAYAVFLFASLHGDTLSKTVGKQSVIDNVVLANYIFMGLVIIMLLFVIFVGGDSLGEFFYRALAASGIIDATLTLIAIIMHKLYVQKHPTVKDNVFNMPLAIGQVATNQPLVGQQIVQVQAPKRRMNAFVIVLIIYISLQFIGAVVVGIAGKINR